MFLTGGVTCTYFFFIYFFKKNTISRMLISVCCTYQHAQTDAARDWRRETTVAALSSFAKFVQVGEGRSLLVRVTLSTH